MLLLKSPGIQTYLHVSRQVCCSLSQTWNPCSCTRRHPLQRTKASAGEVLPYMSKNKIIKTVKESLFTTRKHTKYTHSILWEVTLVLCYRLSHSDATHSVSWMVILTVWKFDGIGNAVLSCGRYLSTTQLEWDSIWLWQLFTAEISYSLAFWQLRF